jgi:hypothetical protein
MKQIINLKNLNRLKLKLDFQKTSNQEFVDNLRAIAIDCNELKRFELIVFGSNTLLNKQIFNCLSFFQKFELFISQNV